MSNFKSPSQSLPFLTTEFKSSEEYADSLLHFATSSHQLQTLCGGIHILDFYTRSPDLYASIIPQDWINWFESKDIHEILDFLLRSKLEEYTTGGGENPGGEVGFTQIPPTLLEYVHQVKRHCLVTDFNPLPEILAPPKQTRHKLTDGMNPKKKHEVLNFARYIEGLTDYVGDLSHIIDFGAGANYLGRTLASDPYNRHVIAVESREHVVETARTIDHKVELTERKVVFRNKKKLKEAGGWKSVKEKIAKGDVCEPCFQPAEFDTSRTKVTLDIPATGKGSVQYIHHQIESGDLSNVFHHIVEVGDNEKLSQPLTPSKSPKVLVTSLHSCGNLVHHGLRTMTLNPTVHAVAMIGCCYNLVTERLTPPSYKFPLLRDLPSQINESVTEGDPHGFPMSNRFLTYKHKAIQARCCQYHEVFTDNDTHYDTGIRLNITARMMGVQAPKNWTREDSEGFFTRHFYRALLQRLFLDQGIVQAPELVPSSRSPAGTGSAPIRGTTAIVIGGLPKSCYTDFVSYIRGAVAKLRRTASKKTTDTTNGANSERSSAANTPHPLTPLIDEKISAMSDEEIAAYEAEYSPRKKHISVIWSLMAFSAQIVEALMVVDRWSWMKEQDCIGEAWVETVFDYAISPRNMVVVGMRK